MYNICDSFVLILKVVLHVNLKSMIRFSKIDQRTIPSKIDWHTANKNVSKNVLKVEEHRCNYHKICTGVGSTSHES